MAKEEKETEFVVAAVLERLIGFAYVQGLVERNTLYHFISLFFIFFLFLLRICFYSFLLL